MCTSAASRISSPEYAIKIYSGIRFAISSEVEYLPLLFLFYAYVNIRPKEIRSKTAFSSFACRFYEPIFRLYGTGKICARAQRAAYLRRNMRLKSIQASVLRYRVRSNIYINIDMKKILPNMPKSLIE